MKKLIILIPTMFLIISSCSEVIELDLDGVEEKSLVVEGYLSNQNKTHYVKLTRTSDYFVDRAANPELGATVTISNEDTTFNLIDPDNDGIYDTDKQLAGEVGKTYLLNIQLNNGEIYTAESHLRPVAPMDSIKYEYRRSDDPFDEELYYHINIFVQEPFTEGDCYQWELFIDGNHDTDTLNNKLFVNDDFVNGHYFDNWSVYQIEEPKIVNDTTKVKLQMLSISKEQFDFQTAIMLETDFSGSGFNGPPANIPTNISNGARGFFSTYAVTEDSLLIFKGRNADH